MDKLAIVVPCYNEEEVLQIASETLRGVLDDLIAKEKIAQDSFVLFVNDGSKDRTWELIVKYSGSAECMRSLGAQVVELQGGFAIVTIEESKIALSSTAETRASLPFISDELATLISQQGLESALSQPLARILEQVQLALDNAQEKPDVIYLTGGSARSPLIKKALAEQLPGIPIAGGDDFGSVTAGLARWAEVVFR